MRKERNDHRPVFNDQTGNGRADHAEKKSSDLCYFFPMFCGSLLGSLFGSLLIKTRARRFTPPSVDDVRAYCQERGNRVDAQRFVDFYAAKGWKIGRNSMKDWEAAVRTWERSEDRGSDADSGDDQGQSWNVPGAIYL